MAVKATALTTAQRVADYGGLGTLAGADLTMMERIVNSTSDFVINYTGRNFKKTTYTSELYTTEYASAINLKNYPVFESESFILQRRNSAMNEDEWETVDGQYFHVDWESGIIYGAGGWNFDKGVNAYRVSYTAGYNFDNATTFLSDTSAGDIELAMWMLINALWSSRKGGGSGNISSERIGDYAVTYKKALMENEDIRSILDAYSNNAGAGGSSVGGLGVLTPSQS